MAAHARWAKYDPKAEMKAVREGLINKRRAEVLRAAEERGEDLSEEEIARRVQALHKAHMARMTLRSTQARGASRNA